MDKHSKMDLSEIIEDVRQSMKEGLFSIYIICLLIFYVLSWTKWSEWAKQAIIVSEKKEFSRQKIVPGTGVICLCVCLSVFEKMLRNILTDFQGLVA